ncbi:MAG: extracellular solute-binding protein [Caldilineaceae bacterium]
MSDPARNPLRPAFSRRQMLKLMGGAVGMAALAACAAPGGGPAPAGNTGSNTGAITSTTNVSGTTGSAAPAKVGGKLTVVHRREYFKEMETIFEDAVKKWGTANNVEVEVSAVASEAFEDFVAKLVAQVQAGEPPDLVYHVRLVQQLYSLDALEPVTDVVEKTEALYGKAPAGQRYANFIDKQWYGIPYIMSGGGAYGRRDVFKAAGIDVDKDMATYEQRRDACLKVSDSAKPMYGWGVTVNKSGDGTGFIEGVIQNWGGHYTDEGMTKITFNSPETIAAVKWMAEIYTSDKYKPMLPPGIISWTDSSNNEAYLAGNIAYTHNAASVYAKAKKDGNPVFKNTVYFETATGPLGKKLEAGGGGQFNIPKGAKNPDAAKALAMYMIQPDVFLPISLISAGLFLPAYQNYYTMPEVVKAFAEDQNLERMGKAALGDFVGSSWPAPPSPFFDAIAAQTVLTDMMAQIITKGAKPEDAVKQAADRIQKIADEQGALKK